MKRCKPAAYSILLTLTISSTCLAGTIVGARTNRTGTIVGARAGTIVGARTGNIAGTRTVNSADPTDLSGRGVRSSIFDLNSLLSENIDGMVRLFLARTVF